jgi:transcriptional regulator with XRE-family HTH domain
VRFGGSDCPLPAKFQQRPHHVIRFKDHFNRSVTRHVGFSYEIRSVRRKGDRMSTQIGKIFSKIIQERRLTFKEISKATGVPATTLAEWKDNRTPKNPSQVQSVARYLGVSMHFLLFGEEDSQEPIQKMIKEDFFQGTFEITVKRVKL